MIMTTKRKKLLLEKRNRLKPIDETQLKSLHILNSGEQEEGTAIELLSPTRPVVLPPMGTVDPTHMPKVKTPFEIPQIDHDKQRARLQNIIESASTALIDVGKGGGSFAKMPKTMRFISQSNNVS